MIKALFAASDADWRTYKAALIIAFDKAGLTSTSPATTHRKT